MEYIIGSMGIAVQFFIGMICWGIVTLLFSGLFSVIGILIQRSKKPDNESRKYEGRPIIIEGGKEKGNGTN